MVCAAQRIELGPGSWPLSARRVFFSPDGKKLVAAGGGVVACNHKQKKPKMMPLNSAGFVCDASYSPDGKYLATLSVRHRDPNVISGKYEKDFLPPVVSLYDGKSNKLIRQFRAHQSAKSLETATLVWLPDSKRLATSCGKVFLWDAESGRKIAEAPKLHGPLGRKIAEAPELHGPLGVCCDGKSLIGVMDFGSVVRWDIETSKLTGIFSANSVLYHLTVSPNGKWIAIIEEDEIHVQSLDGETKYTVPKNTMTIAFSSDSEFLALGGLRSTIDIWSMKQRKYVKRIPLPKYATATISLAFSPDGKRLARSSGTFVSAHIYAFYGYVTLYDLRSEAEKKWDAEQAAEKANQHRMPCRNPRRRRRCCRCFFR